MSNGAVWYAYPPPRMVVTDKKYFVALNPPRLPLPAEAVFSSVSRDTVMEWIKGKEETPHVEEQMELPLE